MAGRLFRHARAALCGAAAVLVLVVLAATGCGGNEASSDRSAPTGTTGAAQRVSSLLAPPDQSFQVIFRERTPYSKDGKYFVWTQGNGMRRWDSVILGYSGKPGLGEFTIDTSLSSAGLGDEGMSCGWYAYPDLPPGQVQLECAAVSDWSHAAFLPLADALHSYVRDWLLDQTVAGRAAACYSFDYPSRYSVSVFCVDSVGIPLALTTVSRDDQNFTRELEAISVSMAEQNIVLPMMEFDEDPLWAPRGEAIVPYSSLQLPDFSQLER